MKRWTSNRREFISATSLGVLSGLAGCGSSGSENSNSNSTPDDTPEPTTTPEPTIGEVIESFNGVYTVGTYEQPDEPGSLADAQYLGRGSFSLPVTHTAQIEYTIDLSVQEGYDTIPLNVYFLDANNYLKLQQEKNHDVISKGSKESVNEKDTFSFTIPAGLYYLVFGSDEVGRESTFSLDYTSQQYLNYKTECSSSLINVGHLSLEHTDTLFNVERWKLRHHIQYRGEAESEYNLELTLISADSEMTIEQSQKQTGDCETNFVYADEETLNVVESGEKILAEIKILDESGEETLAEQTQEIKDVVW